MLPQATLQRLSAGRWFVPLLARMSQDGGGRFGALARQLGVSRSVLSRHLDALEKEGWICRNPGHGHPLRLEYLLTDAGRPLAAWCERVMEQRRRLGLAADDMSRWSMPLLAGLDRHWKRFSTLQAELRPISPRALSLTLKQMMEVRLVDRRLHEAFPPMSLYGLTGRGQALARTLS